MNSIAEFRQSSLLFTFNSSGLDRSTDPWPLHFLFSASSLQCFNHKTHYYKEGYIYMQYMYTRTYIYSRAE